MLQLENISKKYQMGDQEVHALVNVSLHIGQGEFVAIIGPSGSGKSTLMNIIGCLDSPSTGRYSLDGVEVAGLQGDNLSEIRNKKIGFVFQNFNLLPRMSALHNVALPMIYAGVERKMRETSAEGALKLVGLGERMGHRSNELSGGQRQRVAIARALVNQPAIILADEPTGNLDSRSGEEIMAIFKNLNQQEGKTIILVTHEPEIANQAKRVIQVRDGRVVEDRRVQAEG